MNVRSAYTGMRAEMKYIGKTNRKVCVVTQETLHTAYAISSLQRDWDSILCSLALYMQEAQKSILAEREL